MADHRTTSSWFVVGLSVGALAAILYAPKSGRETRRAISQGVNDGVKHLTALGRDARERMNSIVESGGKLLTRKKEAVGAALHTAKVLMKKAG
jgi:gas vesicle protein